MSIGLWWCHHRGSSSALDPLYGSSSTWTYASWFYSPILLRTSTSYSAETLVRRWQTYHRRLSSSISTPGGKFCSGSSSCISFKSYYSASINLPCLCISESPHRLWICRDLHLHTTSTKIKHPQTTLPPRHQSSNHPGKTAGSRLNLLLHPHKNPPYWMFAHWGCLIHGAEGIHSRAHPGMSLDGSTSTHHQLANLWGY